MTEDSKRPIFIHSLFRAGSTWLFDRFRRSSTRYWCYQEPYHEELSKLSDQSEQLLDIGRCKNIELRHPELDKPYFFEFHAIRQHVAEHFQDCISYDSFFDPSICPAFDQYTTNLIRFAPTRPVLQCCRSLGRVAHLKKHHGGVHIHLWRNPWDQWWSYQINDYFDAANLAILSASHVPPVIALLRTKVGFEGIQERSFSDYLRFPLNSEHRYLLFYALWLYSVIENRPQADCDINIDRLSTERQYVEDVAQCLERLGIEDLDLSGCSSPQAVYGDDDRRFFEDVEWRVQALFATAGYDPGLLADIARLQRDWRPERRAAPSSLQCDMQRVRTVAMRYANKHAGTLLALQECESDLRQTKDQTQQVIARAQQAEDRAQQAEDRAQQAEERAQQAEERAQQVRARMQQAEDRAQQAEERAAAAWRRTAIAEAKAAQAEARETAAQDWLEAMRASTSWRMTAPLREVSQFTSHRIIGLARRRAHTGTTPPDAPAVPVPAAQLSPAAGGVPVSLSSITYAATYKKPRSGIPEHAVTHCGGRILFDVSTSIAWRGRHAVGIVRTERELAARLLYDPDLAVLPVVFPGGALRVLEPDLVQLIITADGTEPRNWNIRAEQPTAVLASAPSAKRPFRARTIAPVARALRAGVRLGLRAIPEVNRDEVRQMMIHARQAVRNQIYAPRDFVNGAAPQPLVPNIQSMEPSLDLSLIVYPNENDVFFSAGFGWGVIDWDLIGTLRQACNLRFVSMLYDLIPAKFPEMLGQPTAHYVNYFLHVLDECALALCISECTRRDPVEFAGRTGRLEPPAEVVRLGANVPATPSADEFVDASLRARLARKRFALTVGTFEIRKNYKLLIDLWHELIDDNTFDLDLVIVGMVGWRVEDVLEQLRTSPLFGSRIFWLQGISDASLSWLYESCHIFLFPSLYEGWGLPVVEALQHGRPVIASNRGAVPEAGLGLAEIIDPDDRHAWRRAIAAEAGSPRRRVDAPSIPNWDDTADEVKQHLARLVNAEEVVG